MFNNTVSTLKKEAYQILGKNTPGDRCISEEEKIRLNEICIYLAKSDASESEIKMLFYALCTTATKANFSEKDIFLKLANNFYCDYLIHTIERCIQANLSNVNDLQEKEINTLEDSVETVFTLSMIDEKKEKLISLSAEASQNAKNNNTKITYHELDNFCRDLDELNKRTSSEYPGVALACD